MKSITNLRKFSVLVTFLSLSTLLTSCLTDNCTQGTTMTDPRVVNSFNGLEETPQLVITWDPGTERGSALPDSYFEVVRLNCSYSFQNCPFSSLTDASYDATTKSITVSFSDLSEYLNSNDTLQFALEFPDRQQYINCEHPGSADRYYTQVTLNFNNGEFVDAEFVEFLQAGAF